MNDAVFYGMLALATLVAMIVAERILARIEARRPDDFDGGFSHDHGRRITRIQSPYIISIKGERE